MQAPWSCFFVGLSLILAPAAVVVAEPTTLYVATQGNDNWSGKSAEAKSPNGPFRTLERARDEIRKIKKEAGLPAGGIVVEIAGGIYSLSSPLTLSEEDSGSEGSPIIYRARQGEEVRLVGGVEVSQFKPVTDAAVLQRLDESARGKVVAADLKALDIKDFGEAVGGNRLELFFQDKPMTLARWPNEGFAHIVDLVGGEPHKIHGIPGDKIGRFTYEGDRPKRWTEEKDIWLHGYWFWDWSDQRQQVESIDTGKRVISIKPPYHNYGYRKGQWYYALNLLSEIDQPGEWYLDRTSGMLYFWPPAPLDQGKAVVSVAPSLIAMKNVSHVTVRGLVLEACRGTAIQIDNTADNHVVGCTIRNTGHWAVSVAGRNSSVEGCDIYETADGGISLIGGDRKTLTSGNLTTDNNHIHHFSRWNRTYQAGISLNGVGNRATHNLIHDTPHEAIFFVGNDHQIEFNEIYRACYESNDAGAIYTGRNWTMRGNVIRYNYFHDITGFRDKGCVGVYLDDQFSSAEIVGNLFHKVTSAAFIGGGRDCVIANNIFVDCNPALHIDARGLGWAASGEGGLRNGLKEMPYKESLWASRYPKLVPILDEEPMSPHNNLVARNICVGGRWDDIEGKAKPSTTMQDNLVNVDPHFVDAEHLNFQLKDDSPAYAVGFQKIPMEQFGLREKR